MTKSWKKGESTIEKGMPQHTNRRTKALLIFAVSAILLSLSSDWFWMVYSKSSLDIVRKYSSLTLWLTIGHFKAKCAFISVGLPRFQDREQKTHCAPLCELLGTSITLK